MGSATDVRSRSKKFVVAPAFALSLSVPAIGAVQHGFENKAVAFFLPVSICFFASAFFLGVAGKRPVALSPRAAIVCGGLLLAGSLACAALLNPRFGPLFRAIGPKVAHNERSQLEEGAVKELTAGRYPYYFTLGPASPVSILPGWLFLNIPWYLLHIYLLPVVDGLKATLPLLILGGMALASVWFTFRDYRKADWPFFAKLCPGHGDTLCVRHGADASGGREIRGRTVRQSWIELFVLRIARGVALGGVGARDTTRMRPSDPTAE
jgi:hypothetical protein